MNEENMFKAWKEEHALMTEKQEIAADFLN